jgi:hypothetical protein
MSGRQVYVLRTVLRLRPRVHTNLIRCTGIVHAVMHTMDLSRCTRDKRTMMHVKLKRDKRGSTLVSGGRTGRP